jgi:COMPASS component SWD3
VHEDNAPVTSARFAPNGRFVLAHTLDSAVRLWNYVEGRVCKTYQGHTNQRHSLGGAFGVYGADAFPRDKLTRSGVSRQRTGGAAEWAFVVSGSEDGEIVFWDMNSKEVLQRLKGHEGVVLGVDTHPSERRIVSCGLDKTVRVWVCDAEGEEVGDAPVKDEGGGEAQVKKEAGVGNEDGDALMQDG